MRVPPPLVDTNDQRILGLKRAARRVLDAFRSGHHPTESQLHRLECALDSCEVVLTCGHDITSDCMCDEEYRR